MREVEEDMRQEEEDMRQEEETGGVHGGRRRVWRKE